MKPAVYSTPSGITIDRSIRELSTTSAISHIQVGLKSQAGALFSSGYEYPGRYSRWDIGFFNPPLEITSQARKVRFRARNEKGKLILTWIAEIMEDHPHIIDSQVTDFTFECTLKDMDEFFPEEHRSRQPSLFTLLRHLIQQLGNPEDQHLGLFGAFGYDLVFQFDPITF